MVKTYTPLNTVGLHAGCDYIHSGETPEIIHLNDHAMHAMTDLRRVKAVTVPLNATIDEALVEMHACGVHMLLVVDLDGKIAGIISSQDILGEKPLTIIQEKHTHRKDIRVNMVMTRSEEIVTVPLHEVFLAKVGNVIQTMKNAKQFYALVVETDPQSQEQKVRGIFSLTTICRQLNMDITAEDLLVTNLADLQNRLKEF